MEHQELEARTTDTETQLEESSYSIISYPSNAMPETYLNLIRSSWLRSLRFGNDYFKLIDKDVYFTTYHNYINILLQRPTGTIRLAVLTDEPDVCLGWSLVDGDSLQYVYVQKDYRMSGIGRSLVPTNITQFSHITNVGASLWASKNPTLKFNPFH